MKPKALMIILMGALLCTSFSGVSADHMQQLKAAEYRRALSNLQSGNPHSILHAAWFLGAKRHPRYVPYLGRELNRHLIPNSPYLNDPSTDPYLKTEIAKALAKIRHHHGIPYLITALKNTREIIKLEKAKVMKMREASGKFAAEMNEKMKKNKLLSTQINSKALAKIVPERTEPGPFFFGQGHALPYSPDVNWSPSDERKHFFSTDKNDVVYQFRKFNYNYVNLTIHLLSSVGEIYWTAKQKKAPLKKEYSTVVSSFMKHEYAAIREFAAIALGKMGTTSGLAALQEAFKTEKSERVKIGIAYAILFNDKTQVKYILLLNENLRNPDAHTRYSAVRALRDLELGESIAQMQEILKTEDRPEIRRMLKQAIVAARRDNRTTLTD